MKKLSKIKLSDVRVMDAQEMKMILGGTSGDSECHIVSGSGGGFAGGTGSNNGDVKCSGVCPPVFNTGTMKPQTCGPESYKGLHGETIHLCGCH